MCIMQQKAANNYTSVLHTRPFLLLCEIYQRSKTRLLHHMCMKIKTFRQLVTFSINDAAEN